MASPAFCTPDRVTWRVDGGSALVISTVTLELPLMVQGKGEQLADDVSSNSGGSTISMKLPEVNLLAVVNSNS